MDVEQIRAVVRTYDVLLSGKNVMPQRLALHRTFASCSREELLAHAKHLIDQFPTIHPTEQYGKLNRHLSAIQMCLSFAGKFSLGELLEHNRPK